MKWVINKSVYAQINIDNTRTKTTTIAHSISAFHYIFNLLELLTQCWARSCTDCDWNDPACNVLQVKCINTHRNSGCAFCSTEDRGIKLNIEWYNCRWEEGGYTSWHAHTGACTPATRGCAHRCRYASKLSSTVFDRELGNENAYRMSWGEMAQYSYMYPQNDEVLKSLHTPQDKTLL